MKRSMLVVALFCTMADAAAAQIIRPNVITRPAGFTSLSVGWTRQQAICDPVSDSCWNFGDAPQYRGSLELPLGNAGTWGVAVTSSRVPLVWATQNPRPASCARCNANVNVTQYLGIIHLGASGAAGFQQVVELGAGVTQFTNFRDTSGTRLGSGKAVTDFSFAVSLGVGYNLQSRLQLFLAQEYAVMMHKRQANSPNNSAQQQTTRIGARLALGNR